MDLSSILSKIKQELDEKDRRREEVFTVAREVRRLSTRAIREMHKGNFESAEGLLATVGETISGLDKSDLALTFIQDSLQEYAEAALTHTLLRKTHMPSPEELGIPSEAYILGLADTIGEIRRHILDEMRRDRYDDLEEYLDVMDELYHGIMAFDYPSAILPIRRKQDIARLLIDKTRGEVTIALKQAKLEKKLEEAKGEVEQQRSD
jgi:translin